MILCRTILRPMILCRTILRPRTLRRRQRVRLAFVPLVLCHLCLLCRPWVLSGPRHSSLASRPLASRPLASRHLSLACPLASHHLSLAFHRRALASLRHALASRHLSLACPLASHHLLCRTILRPSLLCRTVLRPIRRTLRRRRRVRLAFLPLVLCHLCLLCHPWVLSGPRHSSLASRPLASRPLASRHLSLACPLASLRHSLASRHLSLASHHLASHHLSLACPL